MSLDRLVLDRQWGQDPIMRYEMRLLDNGWAVWDTVSDTPAVLKGCWQTDLPMEDADDLTDLLNQLDQEQEGAPKH